MSQMLHRYLKEFGLIQTNTAAPLLLSPKRTPYTQAVVSSWLR